VIGGHIVRVTFQRPDRSTVRLLYMVAEEDEAAALALVRRMAGAVPDARIEPLGPVTKTAVRKLGLAPGGAKAI
jgi:hypothetical protein